MSRRIVVETARAERGEHQWLETFNDSPSHGDEYNAITSLSWNGPRENQVGVLRYGKLPKLDLPSYLNYWYYHLKWGLEKEGMVSRLYAPNIYETNAEYIEEYFPYVTVERVLERRGWQMRDERQLEDGRVRYTWTKPERRDSVAESAKRLMTRIRRKEAT
ncbi:hypothetical protein ZOD2009_15011 [Haladaptatus paucihalophilus DX253]|uniref:Uncharacterized protein n=1 Tax=Haladaptatus paucihalophilus DX253 TaxID=797209 RepID=E7QW14_HALPU|nr:hypothetical protein [Haladaptatus paucihalophilus]EFW91427.1 hypothetical protein ZOD2009_15011 [Haladaptatus paucihalophilus DX253]SHL00718.1 hypothetical protein SAMN05444342_2718 [Haladaptatus paucihalophilus DX253]